jgi:uncharacterized protein
MNKVFIIHGFEGMPNGGWRPWLMSELSKQNVYACAPAMPNANRPTVAAWVGEIERTIQNGPKGKTFLIGHSLGAPAILKFIEQSHVKKIDGIILIAGLSFPIKKKYVGEFLEQPFDFKTIKRKVKHIVVIHGTNDPYVHVDQAHFLATNLDAQLILIKNGGHLNTESGYTKLPQCLKVLEKMMR